MMQRELNRTLWIIFGFLMVLAIIGFLTGRSHAQTAIIAPNGSVTYVYPGNPAIVIGPRGELSTAYSLSPAPPSMAPPIPLVIVPSLPMPYTFTPPPVTP